MTPPRPRHRRWLAHLRMAGHYALLSGLAVTTVLPFAWMFFTSLHAPTSEAPTLATLLRPARWRFVGWEGIGSSEPRASVVMDAPRTIVAWFEKIGGDRVTLPSPAASAPSPPSPAAGGGGSDAALFSLVVRVQGSGKVVVDPPSSDGRYAPGTVVTLTAKADEGWHPENYWDVLTFGELPVARFALNSLVVTVGVVLFQLTLCSLAAYAFSRLRFRGRDALFFVFLLTMMIPGQVLIVPLFLIVQKLGWLNTYWGLIIPAQYLSTAFGTFLLRQFFITIPTTLDEAARLDGCGDLRVLWHVILPSSRPALATVAAFAFIWTWTDFYWALLATSTPDMRTLEVGLSIFNDAYMGVRWPLRMTAAVIVLVPVLTVFLLLQRYFVRGVVMSGVKG